MRQKNTWSGMVGKAKSMGYKLKTKVYKTANGTRVMLSSMTNGKGVAKVEKTYNKRTKGGIVSVVQTTTYKSSAKKYRK
jgi:hypothetical protein